MKEIIPAVIALSLTASCSVSKDSAQSASTGGSAVGWSGDGPVINAAPVNGRVLTGNNRPSSVVAKTHIYKTNGDYADRVPVTLNSQRNVLVSFPAPSDVRGAAPVALADGFLLDRRGVGPNTAFTRWTYEEYSKMETVPSPAEIMDNLIPGAAVTEIYEMPFAVGTTDAAVRCDSLIKAGLPGCVKIL